MKMLLQGWLLAFLFLTAVVAVAGADSEVDSEHLLARSPQSYPEKQDDNAVILLYHHVSTHTPAATSLSPAQFESHLQYLAQHCQVIGLQDAIEALQQSQPLPPRTVVISFDDGYSDIYHNAHPLLRKYNMPYTVFVNPPAIGKSSAQLSWPQIQEMQRGGASFANHSSHHGHLLERIHQETKAQWLARVGRDLLQAESDLLDKLGYSLRYIAYPYGEFNAALQQWLAENNFVGFGQHSGAVYSGSDFTALPRYPAAGYYANLDSLKTKINSLAMPVVFPKPAALPATFPEWHGGVELPQFSFHFNSDDFLASQLRCYLNNDNLPLAVLAGTVSVQAGKTLPVGRSRINCTVPSRAQQGRYYWYSQPWFVPRPDGTYAD